MINIPAFATVILELIGKNELKAAIQQLQQLLQGSPLLDEAIGQSARLSDLMKQIRRGTINVDDANVEKNKLRYALIDLVREVEEQAESNPMIKKQVEAALNSPKAGTSNQATVTGDNNIVIQGAQGSELNIRTVQKAEKIDNIDKADFT